jgi:hypothetical protein
MWILPEVFNSKSHHLTKLAVDLRPRMPILHSNVNPGNFFDNIEETKINIFQIWKIKYFVNFPELSSSSIFFSINLIIETYHVDVEIIT